MARRRRWQRPRPWLGIAAALALLVGAVALLTQGDGSEKVPAVDRAPETTEAPTPLASPTAVEAFDRLLQAMADGDIDTAWSMMAPRSRDMWGNSQEAFAGEASGFAEGWSTWLAAERHQEMTMTLASSPDRRTEVVILEGIREPEGQKMHEAWAVPAYYADGTYLFDPLGQAVSAAPIEQLEPRRSALDEGPAPMHPDGRVVVWVDDADAEVHFKLDGDAEVIRRPDRDGTVTWQPEKRLSPGEHLVGVAYIAEDGSVYTLGIPVSVE